MAEETRVILSIFYSNPQRLKVYWRRRYVPPLEAHLPAFNSYNFSMRKPLMTDPCGSNAFAAWEKKITFVLCAGIPGLEIKTTNLVVLSLGIELTV